MAIKPKDMAKMLDHTILKPDATIQEVKRSAKKLRNMTLFRSVSIPVMYR